MVGRGAVAQHSTNDMEEAFSTRSFFVVRPCRMAPPWKGSSLSMCTMTWVTARARGYSDADPLAVVDEVPVDYGIELERDSLMGSGAAEILLTKCLREGAS
jgi:hypothetical protein